MKFNGIRKSDRFVIAATAQNSLKTNAKEPLSYNAIFRILKTYIKLALCINQNFTLIKEFH